MADSSLRPLDAQLLGAVRRHPIWRDASDSAVRALARHARDERYREGQHVLTAGQPAAAIHLLIEGAVRVFYPGRTVDDEITVKLFWAPAAFGDAESILRARWAETVQALTPARVLVADAAAYFSVLQKEPSACFRQYWDVARRFGVAIRTERSANVDELNERVVGVLAAYANHFGRQLSGGAGVVIDYPLTHESLASQVGSNRRSMVRALGRLSRGGLVRRAGRRFVIPDVAKLLATTKSPPLSMSFSTEASPWAERS